MDFKKIPKLSLTNLNKIGNELGLEHNNSDPKKLAHDIIDCFVKFDMYKQKHVDKYIRCGQLGNKGKEGVTYLVKTHSDKEYAMKTFKKTKSIDRLVLEATLQNRASEYGIAPAIVDVDIIGKTIVMEKMDEHLFDIMKRTDGNLTVEHQMRLYEIFKKLDDAGVFQGDSNMMNYMVKNNKIYIIDFGMGKIIDEKFKKKVCSSKPNEELMTLAFIIKLRELGCPEQSYSYLIKQVSEECRVKYNLKT